MDAGAGTSGILVSSRNSLPHYSKLSTSCVDLSVIGVYANRVERGERLIVFHLRALLMVLIVLRLLMPPGICACQWSSPAARMLLALTQSDRQLPSEPQRDNEDDHDAGCPASPLAVGMGVAPPCDPLLPPGLSLDSVPLPQPTLLSCSLPTEQVLCVPFESTSVPLYLTVRTLLL